jgi:glycosyltransferase involved in cell wall biosynthesis
MNLLLLDQFSDLGGAQHNLLELLPAIRDRGWRTLIGLPGDGELFQRARHLGFEVERIQCGPYGSGRKSAADLRRFLTDTPQLALQLRRMAKQVDADLVYLNGPRLLPAAAMAAFGRPVLFHSHSYLGTGTARRLATFALRRLDAWLVAQCEFVAAPWRPFVHPERVAVIYNGVAGPAHPPARSPAGLPRVGCIGRTAPEKGQREFVAAAARIHQALPKCRFVIYGAPLFGDLAAGRYAQEVRTASAALPLEFAGWVDNIYDCLEQLDLLLVPSAGHEATTRVILEAFAAGVPVIAFASGGIPEVVEDGVTGLLANTSEEMAQRAVDLFTGDPQHLIAIARAAHESWARRFTLERYQQQILRAIEASAGSSPTAPSPAASAQSASALPLSDPPPPRTPAPDIPDTPPSPESPALGPRL